MREELGSSRNKDELGTSWVIRMATLVEELMACSSWP